MLTRGIVTAFSTGRFDDELQRLGCTTMLFYRHVVNTQRIRGFVHVIVVSQRLCRHGSDLSDTSFPLGDGIFIRVTLSLLSERTIRHPSQS